MASVFFSSKLKPSGLFEEREATEVPNIFYPEDISIMAPVGTRH